MATTAGVVVTEVLRRVRDEQGAGHTREFTLRIISHAQRLINRLVGAVTVDTTLTLQPTQLIYDLSGTFTDALRVISVRWQEHDLDQVNLQFLRNVDVSWPRNVSGEPAVFSQIGLDLLLIYPVPTESASVGITYVKDTGLIPGEDIDMEVPDHAMPLIIDLAASILLLRQRDFRPIETLFKRIQSNLKGYRNE